MRDAGGCVCGGTRREAPRRAWAALLCGALAGSPSLTGPSSPARKIFSGLRSRWTMPRACRATSALSSGATTWSRTRLSQACAFRGVAGGTGRRVRAGGERGRLRDRVCGCMGLGAPGACCTHAGGLRAAAPPPQMQPAVAAAPPGLREAAGVPCRVTHVGCLPCPSTQPTTSCSGRAGRAGRASPPPRRPHLQLGHAPPQIAGPAVLHEHVALPRLIRRHPELHDVGVADAAVDAALHVQLRGRRAGGGHVRARVSAWAPDC